MAMITLINTLLVKPEQMDEFIRLQKNFALAGTARMSGLLGGRMYRSLKGSRAVLISQFESAEAQAAVFGATEFQAHLAKMREMVESSSPESYAEAYTYGQFK
jgi:heme-degrading monooxygenase HmoA